MVSENQLQEVIDSYQTESEIVRTEVHREEGLDFLFPRLSRAALNQLTEGPATVSRYAIWADTVGNNIIAALHATDDRERRRLLIRAVNSLSAFSELQSLFDPDQR